MILRGLICVLLISPFARADLELAGISVDSAGAAFSVADSKTGFTSDWIRVGDYFEGYKIESFDKQNEMLELEKDGIEYRIKLRSSKVTAAKPASGFSREQALIVVSKRFADSRVVIRAETRLKGNQWFFRCIDVWKADGGIGPTAGEIFAGPTLGPSTTNPIQMPVETGKLFDEDSVEEILFLGAFPLVPGTPWGGFPLSNGKLNLCPDLSVDELRSVLVERKANQSSDPTLSSVTAPAGPEPRPR
jgi:hypothetical protein